MESQRQLLGRRKRSVSQAEFSRVLANASYPQSGFDLDVDFNIVLKVKKEKVKLRSAMENGQGITTHHDSESNRQNAPIVNSLRASQSPDYSYQIEEVSQEDEGAPVVPINDENDSDLRRMDRVLNKNDVFPPRFEGEIWSDDESGESFSFEESSEEVDDDVVQPDSTPFKKIRVGQSINKETTGRKKGPRFRLDHHGNSTKNSSGKSTLKKSTSIMKIVGGSPAQAGEAPWQVLVENMNNAEICGGAIINQMFVLTAAHCTELFKQNGQGKFTFPDNILVILQQPNICSRELISSEKTRRVQKVIDHPKFSRQGEIGELVYDFALLKVKNPMKPFTSEMRPICLPPMKLWEEKFINQFVKVFGYGRTESIPIPGKDQTSCGLLKGDIQVVAPESEYCNKISHFSDVQICAWSQGTDACQGDSGGPLSWRAEETDLTYLIGVVSYGSDVCASASMAGVYTRVTSVMRWLVANIQDGECPNILG